MRVTEAVGSQQNTLSRKTKPGDASNAQLHLYNASQARARLIGSVVVAQRANYT
jgi:hypothetical protein